MNWSWDPIPRLRWAAVLAGLLILALSAWQGAHLAADPVALASRLRQSSAAPVLFLALHVAVSLLFLPRATMAALAGLVFGFWSGLVWATLGCTLGGLAGFLLARHTGLRPPPRPDRERRRFAEVIARVERGGWQAVAGLRLMPVVPHSLTNYMLGLTRIGWVDYVFGSLLGQLPMTVAFVQFGAAGTSLVEGRPSWIGPTLIGAAILLALAGLRRFRASGIGGRAASR